MSDILTAIDEAVGCQQCGGPLGNSPSDDFCRESCRTAWHTQQAQPLRTDPDDFRALSEEMFRELRMAFESFVENINQMYDALYGVVDRVPDKASQDVKARALHLRQTRNTGPALRPLGRR